MLNSDKFKRELCLASSLRDGLEDINLKQIQLLLFDKRANPNILMPPHGISPFHLVIGHDSESFAEEVTKLFLCYGGDPNVKSNDGLTPVHIAAAWGRTNILELLLVNGGNPLSTDDEGYTPFHYAFDGKYFKAITILGKYCEESSNADESPKYKMTLDKILIKNGDMIAEYEISQDSQENQENSSYRINQNYSNDIPDDSLSTDKNESEEIDWNNCREIFSKNQHEKESEIFMNLDKTLLDDKPCQKKYLINKINRSLCLFKSTENLAHPNKTQNKGKNLETTPSRIPKLKCRGTSHISNNKTPQKNIKSNNGIVFSSLDNSVLSKSPNCLIPLSNEKKVKPNRIAQSLFKRKCVSHVGRSKHCPKTLIDKIDKVNDECETSKMKINCDNHLKKTKNIMFDSLHTNCSLTEEFLNTSIPRDEKNISNTNKSKGHELNPIYSENELESPSLFSNDVEPSMNDPSINNIVNNSLRSITSKASVQEEYKYEDLEEGIIFVERRLCITPDCSKGNNNQEVEYHSDDANLLYSSSLSKDLQSLDNATLRRRLTKLGDLPGPITNTTKKIYLKRLVNLEKNQKKNSIGISNELEHRIGSNLVLENWINDIEIYKNLEQKVFQEFIVPDPSRKWREGTSKTCFNYLLLDPRMTQDLPNRRTQLTESKLWIIFLSAIFYVGKGQRTRPYSHLYDAFKVWVSKNNEKNNMGQCVGVSTHHVKYSKIRRILDIWNDGYGVVCLHIFQNTIPVEAYTREALMIRTLGLEQLVNCKDGQYYGIVATWSSEEKIQLGRYILYKAMQIFINEGERQLFPEHL